MDKCADGAAEFPTYEMMAGQVRSMLRATPVYSLRKVVGITSRRRPRRLCTSTVLCSCLSRPASLPTPLKDSFKEGKWTMLWWSRWRHGPKDGGPA